MALARDTNRLRALIALIVVAVLLDASLLVDSSVAPRHHDLLQGTQPNGDNVDLQVVTPLGNWTFASGPYLSANLSTRGEIMAYILTNPGVYMREVSEDLGLSMGVVQYHTWVLSKNGEIEECRTGKYRRFFGAARYSETERKVISLLRQGTAGKIIMALTDEGPMPHAHLAAVLGLSSQALSWHVRRLRAMGVIEIARLLDHEGRSYRLAEGFREEAAAWKAQGQ